MYSYGHAEAERLKTLRRDVDRVLAKAGTATEPSKNEHMPCTVPVSSEGQPELACCLGESLEAVVPRPIEGPARLSLKRKGLGCSQASGEDGQAEDVARSLTHRFRSGDHKLCRQVHAAAAGILQQAVASKEQTWKRRNFLGKKLFLDVPSPPKTMLRTCELNDFICWAVDEVRDYDPAYLPMLHSTLHTLMVHGADPAPVVPQAPLPTVDNVAVLAPSSGSRCQP